jgi:hypothetical protein
MSAWNTSLRLSSMREACSLAPTSCEPYLDNLAIEEGASSYYVVLPMSAANSVSWAEQYSSLSLTHKMMVEIGFDDFVGALEDQVADGYISNPATFVADVLAATKEKNPNLAFGATIYEDALNHTMITTTIGASLRAQFSYVHLFVHYRENAGNYATYVAQAKALFPNAKIIAGGYPYDRINYLPCAFQGTVACTAAQEQSYYQELLQIQANMVNAGTVMGLEFYPGYFGDTTAWGGWTSTRDCATARLSQCYANTNVLQSITQTVLTNTFFNPPAGSSGSGTPKVTLQYSSLYMGTEYVGKTSTPGTMWLKNSGTGTLTVSSVTASGTDGSDFPVKSNCTSVAAGSTCTLTIYLKPTATGTRTGEIVITDSAGTQTVALTGTGLAN